MTCNCTVTTNVSKIKLDDPRSRKAVFLNPNKESYEKSKVDACIIKNSTAADWVLGKKEVADIIVELKGKDVEHAVEQVLATAAYWTAAKRRQGQLAALIVCNEYPRASTKIQRAKQKMAALFKAPLHVATGDREYIYDRVLSFKGPN